MADEVTTGAVVANSDKQKWLLHYFVAWCVAVFAFLLGTLKTDTIKQAFPFCCYAGYNYPSNPSEWTPAWSAIVFWAAALFWMILYGFRLRAESKQAALLREQSTKVAESVKTIEGGTDNLQKATANVLTEVRKTLKSATDLRTKIGEVNDAVQTLPPRNYVTTLSQLTISCHTLCGGTAPRQAHVGDTKADLEPVIRNLLRTMALLAETYDGSGPRYAANVMYFVPSAKFESRVVQECQGFLPLPQEGLTEVILKGALVLRKSLTATARADSDDLIDETSFPIPEPYQDDRDQNKLRVLPGAPVAYAESQKGRQPDVLMYVLSDLWTIGEQLRAKYAFDDEAIARIEEEYSKEKRGRWVRSGLSFPFFEVDGENDRGRVIGVLNIHCNRDVMLGGFDSQMLFARTTLHFVNDIAEAMGLWLNLA